MLEEILLLAGNDIPFLSAGVTIHQPKIKEIAYIGEENFFIGCQLLTFSKDSLEEEAKNNLIDIDNFDILMSIMNSQEASARICAMMVLALLFPTSLINVRENEIHLIDEEEGDTSIINKETYQEFKEIITQMFQLRRDEEEYKPKDDAAAKIAEKLKKGREKAAAMGAAGLLRARIRRDPWRRVARVGA